MTTQQFIEKAIEGGWEGDWNVIERAWDYRARQSIFLDPLAWQAVGNILDEEFIEREQARGVYVSCRWDYRLHMHRMIDALIEGKTIEEFISTL